MARKKSASGRKKRQPSEVAKIYSQLKKINKNIKRLENAGNFDRFASKELINFVKQTKALALRTSKKKRARKGAKRYQEDDEDNKKSRNRTRRHTVVFNPKTKPTAGSLRLIAKKLDKIIKSKTFYNIGIRKMRKEIRIKVTKTLSEEMGRQVTKKEVSMFYEIAKYKTDGIIEQIGASEFFILVQEAKESNQSEDDWIAMLSIYVDTNNEYIREEAKYLYKKFVR